MGTPAAKIAGKEVTAILAREHDKDMRRPAETVKKKLQAYSQANSDNHHSV